MGFVISTFQINSNEMFTKILFCLLRFMGMRFGAYEKTYTTDSEASISAVSLVYAVPVSIMPYIITLVQPLVFKVQCNGS